MTGTPTPRDVFDHPDRHWAFLTTARDEDFEGQHFDRKEAGLIDSGGGTSKSQMDSVRDEIVDTVSAFANANVEGGLLALGISSVGRVKGVDHLKENQLAGLTQLDNLLAGQTVDIKLVPHRGNGIAPQLTRLRLRPTRCKRGLRSCR